MQHTRHVWMNMRLRRRVIATLILEIIVKNFLPFTEPESLLQCHNGRFSVFYPERYNLVFTLTFLKIRFNIIVPTISCMYKLYRTKYTEI
jgi:hypothetical protein